MNDIDDLKQQTIDEIFERGMVVQTIPDSPLWGAQLAYTAGRTMRDRPELLATGLPKEDAAELLVFLDEYDRHEPLEAGQIVPVVANGAVRVKMVQAHSGPVLGAVLVFGLVTCLQAVWADASGDFPPDDTGWGIQPIHRVGIRAPGHEDVYGD